MKRLLPLLLIIVAFSFNTDAQDISGKWQGYFKQSFGDRYHFVVDIKQSKGKITATTHSSFKESFSSEATAAVGFDKKLKRVVIAETKIEKSKIDQNTSLCLMTCHLNWSTKDKSHYLIGQYSSKNMDDNSDCGGGKVYLQRIRM